MQITHLRQEHATIATERLSRPTNVISGFKDLQCLNPENIVVYGGSFDPPHLGHLAVIQELKKHADLVVVMPLGRNPLKPSQPFASDIQRVEMLQEMLKAESNVYIATEEIDRAVRSGKPTITIDTINVAKEELPLATLKLAIGLDCLEKLHLWNEHQRIFNLVEPIVIKRPGYSLENWEQIVGNIGWPLASKLRSSLTEIEGLPELSSSGLRAQILEGSLSWSTALNPAVAEYISAERLYTK
jgi:nicotinate-nucleotide adenylyltransferase